MNDTQRAALLEATLREILSINDEASRGDEPSSIPLECAFDGKLLYRWIGIREKAKELLSGHAG